MGPVAAEMFEGTSTDPSSVYRADMTGVRLCWPPWPAVRFLSEMGIQNIEQDGKGRRGVRGDGVCPLQVDVGVDIRSPRTAVSSACREG